MNWTLGAWRAERDHCGDYMIWATKPHTHLIGAAIDDGDVPTDPRANAHLIAAAPDLYDLLYEVEETLGAIWLRGDLGKRVRAALAKARGELAPIEAFGRDAQRLDGEATKAGNSSKEGDNGQKA